MGIEAGAPTSAAPRIAIGLEATSWLAHRAAVAGVPSPVQLSIWIGWPLMPPRELLTEFSAAIAPWRASGKVTAPVSSLIIPKTYGVPVAFLAVPNTLPLAAA